MNWKDVLRKGEAWEMEQMYGMSSADIVDMFAEEGAEQEPEPDYQYLNEEAQRISEVVRYELNNPLLDKLAKEYVGIWIDFENNKEIENPDYGKMKPLQKQMLDLIKRILPNHPWMKDLTDEEFNWYAENYLYDQNFYYEACSIIGYDGEYVGEPENENWPDNDYMQGES